MGKIMHMNEDYGVCRLKFPEVVPNYEITLVAWL